MEIISRPMYATNYSVDIAPDSENYPVLFIISLDYISTDSRKEAFINR